MQAFDFAPQRLSGALTSPVYRGKQVRIDLLNDHLVRVRELCRYLTALIDTTANSVRVVRAHNDATDTRRKSSHRKPNSPSHVVSYCVLSIAVLYPNLDFHVFPRKHWPALFRTSFLLKESDGEVEHAKYKR